MSILKKAGVKFAILGNEEQCTGDPARRIGNEYLPYMNFELILIEGKYIMKITCKKSDKPVFLKYDSVEEFYIRVGASSLQIIGSKILDYIRNRFND